MYGDQLKGMQILLGPNIGKAKQDRQTMAGTNFTKPCTFLLANLCSYQVKKLFTKVQWHLHVRSVSVSETNKP